MAISKTPETDKRTPQKPTSCCRIHTGPRRALVPEDRLAGDAHHLCGGLDGLFLHPGPELTLEDSGELVTASGLCRHPHPPGYPVWSIYSWLWTVLLPFGNFAWRVAVGQATATALACGLLAFTVSRGSSLLVESIEELKNMTGKWENAICLVSGFVAGVLVGLDGFIWSESIVVNRIAVFSLPWFMLLLICLLRWLYAPHQLRYAYLAALLFGVCITIHQSLIVAALGIEVAIAVGNPRLGRTLSWATFWFMRPTCSSTASPETICWPLSASRACSSSSTWWGWLLSLPGSGWRCAPRICSKTGCPSS